ncbi:hypothetical protein EWM64_g3212 [Hericium alpestre]|uniref:Uncharacterized protein n=1 Tax=Hericium alpestre TaxID=135208 RepID=A0A4Z0A4I1_9AGAM|nr:hypothetical protein EWM64_g3212 [Hericium alpestre]
MLLGAYAASIVKLFKEDQKVTTVLHHDVLQVTRSLLPIPAELLREIILLFLADAFFELVVTPDLDVNWDPLSPLLHTSFHFRQEFLAPDIQFLQSLECESPILWQARAFMLNTMYLRLLEARMPQLGEERYADLWTYIRRVNDTALSITDKMPASIRNAVFAPIQNHLYLSRHLVERIFIVQIVCIFCAVYWAAPEHVTGKNAPLAGLVSSLERGSKAVAEQGAELAKMGLKPDQWLPIPQAVLDAVSLPKCWGVLKGQISLPVKGDATRHQASGRVQDNATHQFGLRLRDHLSVVLSPDQKARCLTQGVEDIPLAWRRP